jgi:phosphohistidine phosphatase
MKLLFIARHAKSSWSNLFSSDFDRGLNARGKRDLKIIKELLATQHACPDIILASPAKRTKKTANAYAIQW